jgi:hypothetical protein
LLSGHIAADCTADKGQAAALRVILERFATTHEAVITNHEARSAVRAWYRTNGADFGRLDANVLSLITAAVNKAGLAVLKSEEIPAVKRAVGRKTNPVHAVSSDDDSSSESSFSSSFYIDFSFKRVAEEAIVVYAGLNKTSGDTHRSLRSMLDLSN